MSSVHQRIEMPVRKSTSGDSILIRIESPLEMEDWGEEVNGPLSLKALTVIEEFFGVKPKITSWLMKAGIQIPNTYEFPVSVMAKGAHLSFRIWRYGIGNNDQSEIDICAKGGKPVVSGLYCTPQKVTWIGIGHNNLLVATQSGVLYRAMRERLCKQDWRGRFWRFSKVYGFWIEMSSLQNTHLTGFASYIPAHLLR